MLRPSSRRLACLLKLNGFFSPRSHMNRTPIRRGVLDLTNPGPRMWSGSEIKEAQMTIHDIVESQVDCIKRVVPWFLGNMPASYFLNVSASLRAKHVKAIATMSDFKHSDLSVKLETFGERHSEKEWSFITVGANASKLLETELQRLERDPSMPLEILSCVKVYTSADKQICILVFTFTLLKLFDSGMYLIGDLSELGTRDGSDVLAKLKDFQDDLLATGSSEDGDHTVVFSETEMSEYLSKCSPSYVAGASKERFLLQKELYQKVFDNESTAVDIQLAPGGGSTVITVAATNILPEQLVLALANYLRCMGLEIRVLTLDCIEAPREIPEHSTGYVVMGQISVTRADMTAAEIEAHCSNIKRLKWTSASVVDLGLARFSFLGLDRAEIISALCTLMHGALKPNNPHAFASPSAIIEALASDVRFMKMAGCIADLFFSRFHADSTVDTAHIVTRPLLLKCQEEVNFLEAASGIQENPFGKDAVMALRQMVLTVGNVSDCNIGVPTRFALSMTVSPGAIGDPAVIQRMDESRADTVFVFGYNFSAFHCRFGPLSRGGLAIWAPKSAEIHAVETADHFKQTYEAAYAQNLVNKDIPSTGSKSIILLNPGGVGDSPEREFFLARGAMRAFTDSLLDLEVIGRSVAVKEFAYASPVDRVIPSDLIWLYRRMKERGIVNLIPRAAYRERDFEMNAETLVVFLATALKQLVGIDPATEPFTVKLMNRESELHSIMGLGHLLNVLIREYPDTCKVVAIATGNSVLVDTNGIDHQELLRLYHSNLPMGDFAEEHFSADGYVVDLSTPEISQQNIRKVLRIGSDVYIPCSPYSHDVNLMGESFLTGSEAVLSKLVVEGAANAVSPLMLNSLRDSGISVIKSSSSLKGFAIAAEWEPLASLFHHYAGKDSEIVWRRLDYAIVGKVRRSAHAEADLLLREFKRWEGSLPELSDRVSRAINRLKGLIVHHLLHDDPEFEKIGMRIFLEDWGFSGVNSFTDADCSEALPVSYRQALIASSLGSMFVYREGLEAVEKVSSARLLKVVHKYFIHYDRIHSMVTDFGERDMSNDLPADKKAYMLELLDRCGPRAAMLHDSANKVAVPK